MNLKNETFCKLLTVLLIAEYLMSLKLYVQYLCYDSEDRTDTRTSFLSFHQSIYPCLEEKGLFLPC